MKKIIGIFAILLIATGVFGQMNIRNHSFIERTSKGLITIEDAIHRNNITDGNFDWIDYIHFVRDGKLFLLSYEPKENHKSNGSRDVYLYSKDINDINNPWERASRKIMTNSYSTHSFCDVDFFTYDKDYHNTSIGKIVENDDGTVMITIGWELFSTVRGAKFVDEHELTFKFVHNPYGRVEYLHERIYK